MSKLTIKSENGDKKSVQFREEHFFEVEIVDNFRDLYTANQLL